MKRNTICVYLHNDVVTEILLRLPAKSLGRCKSVCKTWYNLIQNDIFIKNHMNHPQNPNRLLAFSGVYASRIEYVYTLFTEESLSVRKEIKSPVTYNIKPITRITGPVNGLYLITYRHLEGQNFDIWTHILWNPSTSEFRKLPSPSLEIPPGFERVTNRYYGFGSVDDDVKVVIIKQLYHKDDENLSRVAVTLYSLARDSWKDINNFPSHLKIPIIENQMSTQINGVCYWTAYYAHSEHHFLLEFDMKSEVFRGVNLPHVRPNTISENTICVRDSSSIILFVQHYSRSCRPQVIENVDLWELKEGEWLKLLAFDPSSEYVNLDPVPHWFRTKDEVVIQTIDNKVVLYNINSHKIRDLKIDGAGLILLNYKESLTSVRGGNAQCEGTLN